VRVPPAGSAPGGVVPPLGSRARDAILAARPAAWPIARRTLEFFRGIVDRFQDEIASFGVMPSMYAGLVDAAGNLQLYDGRIRFRSAGGEIVEDVEPAQYKEFIGEAAMPDSYLKAPYFKPLGYPEGIYRVGPLARLNVAEQCGTPEADVALAEFRQRFGRIVDGAFHYHYARLIEIVYALERLHALLDSPVTSGRHVRARASVNALEGVGIIEAPRGILIHHYQVDESGAIRGANLIVATGHNNLAIGRSVEQVAKRFVNGNKLEEGMLNRVSAVVRAFDPCLSCSTHAGGILALRIQLVAPSGEVLDELHS
jgi:NAD-reducing hydrogenase large subunit